MKKKIDLSQLVVDRSEETPKWAVGSRGRLLSRYVVPAALMSGFLMLFGWAARSSFLPAKSVAVVPVLLSRAEVQQAGTPLFQAAGWVEPRPTPVLVCAQAAGVIKDLLVVEGQAVKVNEPIAKLIDLDARIALSEAEVALQLKEADLAVARAALDQARTKLEQPVHLQSEVAEADAQLARARTELSNLPFAIRTAEAQRRLAEQIVEGKKKAGDAIPVRSLLKAQSELAAADSALDELKARGPFLAEQAEALQRKCKALAKRLELKADEIRAMKDGQAKEKAGEARVRQAKLAIKAAYLRLKRMTIYAPISGRVLALIARPGDRLAGMDPRTGRGASNVISLYDPNMLQVRVDVRLEDVPQVQPGQTVRIETAAVPGGLEGTVLHVTSSADIQKNTLQVKVAIHSPPPVIKPEMLTQATFLAPEQPGKAGDASEDPLRLLVPRQLVSGADGEAFVWVADRETSRARKQPVTLGKAGTDELIEVVEGLTAMDKLIASGREGLADGERITIVGEDSSLGTRTSFKPPAAGSPRTASGGDMNPTRK